MSDLISREQAIDALERKKDKNAKGDIGGFYNKIIQNDIDTLMQLPSAEKTGKWIKKYRGNYMCSVCGAWYKTTDEYGNIIDGDDEMKSNNYCSNCGARMVE